MAAPLGEAPRVDPRVPALTILAHPDGSRVGERVLLPALASGREVLLSRREPLFAPPDGGEARPLFDAHLSRTPAVLARGEVPGSLRIAADPRGSRIEVLGTAAGHEVSRPELEHGAVLLVAERVALLLHLLPVVTPASRGESFGLFGESAAVAELRRAIPRAAEGTTPVLLRGETGTGKELVARAIHDASPRRERPYLAVNLGAVPPALAAAELFGAARGAFTGADRRREGYFARADGGTLFLDEVGEASLEVQAMLLRALENGEIQPVGEAATRRVDVRVVAATDADLEAAAAAGRFRPPLLHRLRADEIHLAPLRARRDDVGRLLVFFLRQELAAVNREQLLLQPRWPDGPWLPARLVAQLAAYDWPGNVRELRNVAHRLVAIGRDRGEAELPADVEAALRSTAGAAPMPARGSLFHIAGDALPPTADGVAPSLRRSYRSAAEIADDELFAALQASRYNVAAAAARLGVSRTALYGLLHHHPQIRKAGDLGHDEIAAAVARNGGDLDAAAAELQVSTHGLRLRRTQLGIDDAP